MADIKAIAAEKGLDLLFYIVGGAVTVAFLIAVLGNDLQGFVQALI